MKKNLRLIIFTITFVGLAVFLLLRDSKSTMKEELRDFAVKDTASITKIFIADRNGKSVTLMRKKGSEWKLNDSIRVKTDMVNSLLQVIHSVSVKSLIPKAAFNNMIKNLASTSVKCEIYLEDEKKPAKTYYVGGQTQDDLGTYMILENSSVPFVTEIPGFNGYLTPRYSTNADDWILPVVFSSPLEMIQSIAINYPSFPDRSFLLETDQQHYHVTNPITHAVIRHVDSVAVDNFLMKTNVIYYESRETRLSATQKDSLLTTVPLSEIKIRLTNSKEYSISIFPMEINEHSMTLQDSLGQPLKYDLDRMIVYVHSDKAWYNVQHFSFDHLLRKYNDFEFKQKH